MAIFDFLVGKKKDPTKESQPYFDKAMQGYQPYMDVTQQLAQDPGAYLEQLMGGYHQTAGFQESQNEALRAAMSSSAAGGRTGTEEDMINQGMLSNRLTQEDMQKYLQNVSGLLGMGLSGGLQGAGGMAGIYGTQAGMGAQQAQETNKGRNSIFSTMGGLAGAAGGAYATGTPQGALAGYNIGSGAGSNLDSYMFDDPKGGK